MQNEKIYSENDITQGTQTFQYPQKVKEVQTNDTIRVDQESLANPWIIFDAIQEEKQKETVEENEEYS
jgi:hypothetical protein